MKLGHNSLIEKVTMQQRYRRQTDGSCHKANVT